VGLHGAAHGSEARPRARERSSEGSISLGLIHCPRSSVITDY
jgi:hypothetical protein